MAEQSLTEKIRSMEAGTNRLFKAAKMVSVKAIASRIASTAKPIRKYVTETEKDGIRVWRLK